MEEESIFNLYHRVHKELIKIVTEYVEPYEFNRGELPVLACLVKREDGLSQKEIRDIFPVSKSTMSKNIDSLVQKGYLRKEKDPEDKRATLIYLTEKGEEVEGIIRETNREVEKTMLEDFSETEEEELRDYLVKMLNSLEE